MALASSATRWATVPAFVTVPAGATNATFTVTTFANDSGQGQSSVITASAGGVQRQQSLGINPPPAATPNTLSSFVLDPAVVEGGQTSTGRVTLATPAPSGGTRVDVIVNSALASAPPLITIPEGQSSGSFAITTQPHQGLDQLVSIAIGTVNSSREATLRITQTTSTAPEPALNGLALAPSSVTGGQTSTGTVTLTASAPAGGLVVALASSNTAAATVPASVTVPAGASSATFAITTTSGSTTRTAIVSASANGVNRTATLTVNGAATGTVTITRAEYNSGRLRIEATSSPTGTMTAYVTSTGQLIGTLSSGRLEVNWPSNPGTVTVRSTNGGEATRSVTN